MKLFLRYPWVSVAALAVYAMVNIGAGALHHHHGAETPAARLSPGYDTSLQLHAASPVEDDDDDDDGTCLLCKVLHLAQTLATSVRVEAVTALTGKTFSGNAVFRAHPLETATHSRAPPSA